MDEQHRSSTATSAPPISAADPQTTFVARQAMLDQRGSVYGYRLLAAAPAWSGRHGSGAHAPATSTVTAAAAARTVAEVGVAAFVGAHPAVLPVDLALLGAGLPHELPSAQIVLEVPAAELNEDPAHGATLLRTARSLGFGVAIGGTTPVNFPRHVAALADIISFEALHGATPPCIELSLRASKMGIITCASGVETPDTYEQVKENFALFVGSYYQRPAIDPETTISTGRLTTMQLLAECANPDASLRDFEAIVARDPALAFRVMELANSAAAGLVRRIDSLSHAMLMVGVNNIRNLAMIASLNGLHDRAPELLRTVLLRAKTCELIASRTRQDPTSAFTAGLLSLLDAFIAMPLEQALERVQLSEEIQDAILGHRGRIGEILRTALACERALFPPELTTVLPVSDLAPLYLAALAWVEQLGLPTSS
jgi:EAL and modified HD-GYP domain-containing signal transduction protein